MKFKLPKLKKQWGQIPCFLQLIVEDFDSVAKGMGHEITVTRILDRIEGATEVHPEHRAVDVRDVYLGEPTFTPDQRDYLLNYINTKYPRYDGYKTVMWHEFKGGPSHFHIQVAPTMVVYISDYLELGLLQR